MIVATGQVGGVRCDDCLMDCGASTCYCRRSWAERVGLPITLLAQPVNVTLADGSVVVATHEVRVDSMRVHGRGAPCRMLVLDDLSNEVIAGLDWQRAAKITIEPGVAHDLLNGKPVRRRVQPAVDAVNDWPTDQPIRLAAVMTHAARLTKAAAAPSTDNTRLQQVLLKHQSVFAEILPVKTPEQIAKARQFSIVLVADDVRPVKQHERRVSPAEIEAATQWVREECAAGRMEASTSEWAAQLVIVPKRNDKGEVTGWRICGDYRNLNEVTKADAEPLPLLQTVFDQLNGMKFFSKLDLLKGFNQIPVQQKSREYMAVSTPLGLYQPTVMPFGVKNAPGAFQREMRRVLKEKLHRGVYVYIDDIIVYSRTEDEHIRLIDWVLSRLKEEGYYAHPGKCLFLQDEVSFLGHKVSGTGVSMQQHKVKDLRDWPTLQTVKDVRRFLGLANFYRRFVKDFSLVAQPLTALTQTAVKKKWQWGAKEQAAFDELKRRLTEAPVLAHPDPLKQWTVQTDASGYAIGAVLSQKQDDGTVRPVAYWSSKLSPAECRYSATERELMAIVKATQHWRSYLFGSPLPILLKSDHQPLVYLNGKPQLGMRLSRWMEELSDMTFEIGYVKGKHNAAADALSRRSDHETAETAEPPSTMKVKLVGATHGMTVSRWQKDGQWMDSSEKFTASLSTAQQVERTLQFDTLWDDMRVAAKTDEVYQRMLRGEQKQDGLVRRDGLLFDREKRVQVPNDRRLRTRLLELAHDAAGHFGRQKTIERLGRHCWWVGLLSEAEDYCRSCAACSANKSSNQLPAGTLKPLPIPDSVWDSIGIDFVGPLPPSKEKKNNCILVLIDRFSKMVMLRPCKTTITASKVGQLVVDMMTGIGKLPTSIVSDRDVRFTGAVWQQLWASMGTQLKMSTAYHPQTDGQTERMNRTMQTMLRSYAAKREDWEEWLPFVAAAYNSTQQESTKRTPFEMNFPDRRGIDPLKWALTQKVQGVDERGVSAEAERTIGEMKLLWNEVRTRLSEAQLKQKKDADRRRRPVKYEVGDSVWLSTHNLSSYQGKLKDKWVGPYMVTAVIESADGKSTVSVKLDTRGELGKVHSTFHVSLVKPYVESRYEWPGRRQAQRPAPELIDGESEWEVECVVDKRTVQKDRDVEVKEEEMTTRAGRVIKPATTRIVKQKVDVVEYKVRWKGWDESDDTWKEESELPNARQLVDEYELLKQQAKSKLGRMSAVMELGVATAVWCGPVEQTVSGHVQSTVSLSFACAA
jgi:hypothetical protein